MAENILLFTDVQVKHSTILNKRPIEDSALDAINNGADGIIVTGKWTGDSPLIDDLKRVKKISGKVPVIIGSGADKENICELINFADSVIVSTSLKEGHNDKTERNVKGFNLRIDSNKVKEFVHSFKKYGGIY